jgi:selT/selW/selH-like putative selenoprotein
LADFLEKQGFDKPSLVQSSGGAFEVRAGNFLLFSKLKTGRFPEHAEVLNLIRQMQSH